MREDIRQVLARGEMVVGDGAFGTEIQKLGIPAGTMPELWNADHPDVIARIHQSYLDAGSQIISANTFGANGPRLGAAGASDRVAELNRLGIEIAKQVAGDRAWVGASVGPTGELLQPFGTLTMDELERIYIEQIEALAATDVDIILLETHHDLEEASCAVRVVKERTSLPVFCTFAFNGKGRTMMGLRPGDAAQRVQELGGDAVGANCGEGPEAVVAALEGMHGVVDIPLIAQANAGIPSGDAHGEASWDVTAALMADYVLRFVELGARVVGGCCGTGPQHIAAIVAALK